MKNVFLTITAGFILLAGCSIDESFEPIDEQSTDSIYLLDHSTEQNSFSILEIDNFVSDVNYTSKPIINEFGHTSGLYEPMMQDPVSLSWLGNCDGTGTYGAAELEIRKPSYTIYVLMETECVTIDGNKAMYGGTITEVMELSGNTPDLTAMWRFYFQVIDNDKNSNNGIDQISNIWIFASPRSASLCSVYAPEHRIWSSKGHANVLPPGFVEVSCNPE
ncbi:MAG: hypothetical protein HKN52_08480 [Eudoraea sp.]|nr:hypothetical protein [Eudoraea sp.]